MSTSPRPRADALRNRARLISEARELFAQATGQVTLDAIAQAAGVGIGTLYRHFPTKEALSEAVFEEELDALDEVTDTVLQDGRSTGLSALRRWMDRYAQFVATKHAMHGALRIALSPGSGALSETRNRMNHMVGRFVEAGIRDGSMRADVMANELTLTLAGAVYVATTVNNDTQVQRVLDFIAAGLRDA